MNVLTTPLTIIPLRAEPSHRSEMVSQVLFAEHLLRLDEANDFVKIRMLETGYEGWVQRVQVADFASTTETYDRIVGLEPVYATGKVGKIRLQHGTPIYTDRVWIGGDQFDIHGVTRIPVRSDFKSEFPKIVKYYLRAPYLWGGRSASGIDCSGFSQIVFSHFGIRLKRDACQQAEFGETVDFSTEIKPGDLAFFDNESGHIVHVGIMIDTNTIVHATGEVRIDKMDQQGIYNSNLQKYTHQLRVVKRYF